MPSVGGNTGEKEEQPWIIDVMGLPFKATVRCDPGQPLPGAHRLVEEKH